MKTPHCKRCGRILRNPKWIEIGLGPVCIKKQMALESKQAKEAQKEVQP